MLVSNDVDKQKQKENLIFLQNKLRYRILAYISLCDKIFSQVRNKVYPELKSQGDFFGKIDFLDSLNEKLPEDQIRFFNKIRFNFFIDVNCGNFNDKNKNNFNNKCKNNFNNIFIKINVLRNWLIHHILDDKIIKDQNLRSKFENERNKFPKANFNFNKDLIDKNILNNLLKNLEGGLFKLLPQEFCNEIYHQFWTFEKLLNGNSKEDKFKDSKFGKNFDKLKKEKKDFISKINPELQKNNELATKLAEINKLKFIFKNKTKKKEKKSDQKTSTKKPRNQGRLTVDATKYVFIGKNNFDIIKKDLMTIHQITNKENDKEKSKEFINKYNKKKLKKPKKCFEEIDKIYLFALEINILFRIYFTDKFNEMKDNNENKKDKELKSKRNELQIKQTKLKQLNKIQKNIRTDNEINEIANLTQEIGNLTQEIEILKQDKNIKNLRNSIDHSDLLQILVPPESNPSAKRQKNLTIAQPQENQTIAQYFEKNLQIAIKFIEKYDCQNSDKIANEFLNRLYQLFTKNDYLFLRFSDENQNFQKINIRFDKNHKNSEDKALNIAKASIENNESKPLKPRSKVHKKINEIIKKIIEEKEFDKEKIKIDIIKFYYYASLKTSLIFDAHRIIKKARSQKIQQKNLGN